LVDVAQSVLPPDVLFVQSIEGDLPTPSVKPKKKAKAAKVSVTELF
jgi:hypothetical protein